MLSETTTDEPIDEPSKATNTSTHTQIAAQQRVQPIVHPIECGLLHRVLPKVDSSVAFRYSRGVTIPGKGGRPRKWRSDADRARAYRARQRGDEEPPVLAAALDDGDALAAAWEQVRQLGLDLDEHRQAERNLRRELRDAERELDARQHQLNWLKADNDALRSQLEHAEQEAPRSRRPSR